MCCSQVLICVCCEIQHRITNFPIEIDTPLYLIDRCHHFQRATTTTEKKKQAQQKEKEQKKYT